MYQLHPIIDQDCLYSAVGHATKSRTCRLYFLVFADPCYEMAGLPSRDTTKETDEEYVYAYVYCELYIILELQIRIT